MNSSFSLFLAFKYLKPKRSLLSVMTLLSLVGVMLGVAVLIIVLSVMTGFDKTWSEKIFSFNAHVKVTQYGGIIPQPYKLINALDGVEGITGMAPNLEGLVFLQTEKDKVHTPMLRGVDPEFEPKVSQVPEKMKQGTFSVGYGEIIIGQALADNLGVGVGDCLRVYSPQNFVSQDELRLPEELTISGIFDVGMWEFDANVVLTSLNTARSIFNVEEGVHNLQIMTEKPMQAHVKTQELQEILGPYFTVRSWIDINRQMFTALRTEKNMMFFLLVIITLVATFCITSAQISLVVQKTNEIGLLKALGFPNARIVRVFLWIGAVQGVIGLGLGLGLGMLVLRFRNELLRFISRELNVDLLPPELYQLSQIPAHTTLEDVLGVSAIVMVFCLISGIVPAWSAARLEPVEALRNE